jgi:DNA-binding GntR family transcriptional regulator
VELLEVAATSSVVELERLRLSGEEILVHSINVFASTILATSFEAIDWTASLVDVFRSHGREAVSSIVDVQAVNLATDMAARFGLPVSDAWLRLSGPAFDRRGHPLWWSTDVIRGDVRTLRVVNRSDPTGD